MELQERINVLIQGVELAQKAGALTLDDAAIAKKAIDVINQGVAYKEALTVLVQIVEKGQKKGVYTLRDAYLLFIAADNFESSIPAPAPAPVQTSAPTTAQTPPITIQPVEEEPVAENHAPGKKTSKKKESN